MVKLEDGTLVSVEWDEDGDTLLTYRVKRSLTIQTHGALILMTDPDDRCLYHKEALSWDTCSDTRQGPCIVEKVKDVVDQHNYLKEHKE